MGKALVGLVATVLIGFLAYQQFTSAPLDARAAIEAAVSQVKATTKLSSEQEQVLRVQIAIADYTATHGSEPPDSLDALVPKYFDSVPIDPSTGEAYQYAKNGSTYQLGAEINEAPIQVASAKIGGKKAAKSSVKRKDDVEFVNPNTMQLESFTYDPTGKRDPFEPFDFSPDEEDLSKPPLERYTIGQLKVTAILEDSRGGGERSAIVEDARGRGYTIRKGSRIGNQNGVVVSIDADKINIVETIVDFTGKETKVPVEMRRPTRDDEDGSYSSYKQSRHDRLLKR